MFVSKEFKNQYLPGTGIQFPVVAGEASTAAFRITYFDKGWEIGY